MNHPMQPIIQHLFQVSSLEDVSRQRLESFVQQYPSFGIGHYLLSRKLRAEGADQYETEIRKANLYFTNPFWLQWLLENSDGAPGVGSGGALAGGGAWTAGGGETDATALEIGSKVAEVPEVEYTPESETVISLVEPIRDESLIEPVKDEPVAELVKEELGWAEKREEPVAAPEEEAVPGASAAEQLLESLREARELRESLVKMNEDFNADRHIAPEGVVAAEGAVTDQGELAGEPIKDEEAPFVLDEEEAPAEALAAGKEDTEVSAGGAIAHAISMAEPELVFEPYHTIDYFASQGIKLTLEDNPSDQLGKQLKSFTDWLKMMRRLPQKEREMVPDRVAEQTVQTIAAHSVVGREVVTETMAEVLAKQGMPERARAMYEKLSLLNPDKRAYFATKIEQLNSH